MLIPICFFSSPKGQCKNEPPFDFTDLDVTGTTTSSLFRCVHATRSDPSDLLDPSAPRSIFCTRVEFEKDLIFSLNKIDYQSRI